eukprot:gnl/Hemi2/12537_TR4275_c0_g1_i1.p1 gnl/Hemi2/12537_TR4275_c0_g1~~gnl/Hemi2/12537_TR4275_c0_g1_i1.p1  ORF type:complete len:521 (+),score=117.17 gnl/Hemi2/12537_TR4275_c0_g1_i1:109-1671(+)
MMSGLAATGLTTGVTSCVTSFTTTSSLSFGLAVGLITWFVSKFATNLATFAGWIWSQATLRNILIVVVLLLSILYSFFFFASSHQLCDDLASESALAAAASDARSFYCTNVTIPTTVYAPPNNTAFGDESLPYINNQHYLRTLARFACILPAQSALLVWGPKSVGKTLGLKVMRAAWEAARRPVVRVDLKDFSGNMTTFRDYLYRSLLLPYSRHDVSSAARSIRSCVRHRPVSSIPLLENDFLLESANTVGWQGPLSLLNEFITHGSYGIQDIVSGYFFASQFASGMDFTGLLEALELLAVQKPHLAPIIILQEIQSLRQLNNGPELLGQILHALESKKQAGSLVSVILETSDLMWVDAANLLRSKESFRDVLVHHLSHDEAEKQLVDTLQAFTPAEFETLWTAVGGHAGSINAIYMERRSGASLQDAISHQQRVFYSILLASLSVAATHGLREECETVLSNLTKTVDFSLKLKQPFSPAVQFLLTHHNVLFVHEAVVTPQHTLMKHAITTYLTDFPLPE